MKIGLITINDFNNYGNRLQNYSIQAFLSKNNHQVITLRNYNFSNTKKLYLLRKIKNISFRDTYSSNESRKDNFKKFNKNILFSDNIISAYSKHDEYDFYITGSDQVWNPYIDRLRDVDLLSFVEPSKRISFAASLGVNQLPDKYLERTKKELLKFKAISVRENKGKEIIENLTARTDIEVLIDPTMLLDSEEWDKVSSKPKMLKSKKYILNYFLGSLSDDTKREIERIAKKYDCEIINLLDKKSPFYECGPSEFLYLEKHAFLICTDSFHSSIFAIIYNRPFVIFNREDNVEKMNSRLDTLIYNFKLENRKFEGVIKEKNLNHNYSEAYKILEVERQKSKDFLDKSFGYK